MESASIVHRKAGKMEDIDLEGLSVSKANLLCFQRLNWWRRTNPKQANLYYVMVCTKPVGV